MLSNKELFLLQTLEKTTLATNRQLLILCGYHDPSVIRKRLNRLKAEGYITAEWMGDKLAYTLTQAGLSELEKTRRPYEIRGCIKSEHEELVTEAACWLYIRAGRSITEMLFDHELNSIKAFKDIGHKPDIVFSQHQCLEMELSSKQTRGDSTKNGLEDNIMSNARNFSRQTWIVPDHKPGLMTRIKTLAKNNGVAKTVNIFPLSTVISEVAAYDARNNAPRTAPLKGMPSLLHSSLPAKETEVVLDD